MKYIAKNLSDIAELFEQFQAQAERLAFNSKTMGARDQAQTEAMIWASAARILRATTLEPQTQEIEF